MPTVDVYADLLFLINAAMDGLCLSAAARLCHRRTRAWRLLLAAVVGGVYAPLALLVPVGRWTALLVDLGVCGIMCVLTFGRRRLWSVSLVYIALSMALGGVMTALYNLFNQAGLADHLPAAEDGAGAWLFLLLALGGMVITLRGGHVLRRASSNRFCTVTVTLGDRSLSLCALIDTGNHLTDPLDGRAVICVDQAAITPLVSLQLRSIIDSALDGQIPSPDALADLPEAFRFRLIPTQTATGHSLLPALRPDRITITPIRDTPRRSPAPDVDALIALIPTPTGDFQAILPAELYRN